MPTKNSDVSSKKSNSGVVTKPTMAKTHAARTDGLFLDISPPRILIITTLQSNYHPVARINTGVRGFLNEFLCHPSTPLARQNSQYRR
jgi:hypothetical protein